MNVEGIKLVTIGGGTGSFTLLSALKNYVSNINAIVNMADDGGSTGKLRDELGALPPGDVRQCLVALSNSSETVRKLFNYRFEEETSLSGHSFGNLFLSALEQVTGSFSDAVTTAGEILSIHGSVLPVTLSDVRLKYTSPKGEVIMGENIIGDTDLLKDDKNPQLSFSNRALINPYAQRAIITADLIVLAPGTIYGSLGPALMVEGMSEALEKTKAEVVYVANLTSSPDITGYDLGHVVSELERMCGSKFIDTVLINNDQPDDKTLKAYASKGQELLVEGAIDKTKKIVRSSLISVSTENKQTLIRHDGDKVARQLMKIYFS